MILFDYPIFVFCVLGNSFWKVSAQQGQNNYIRFPDLVYGLVCGNLIQPMVELYFFFYTNYFHIIKSWLALILHKIVHAYKNLMTAVNTCQCCIIKR